MIHPVSHLQFMGFAAGPGVPPAAAIQPVVSSNLVRYIVPRRCLPLLQRRQPQWQIWEPATQRDPARFVSVQYSTVRYSKPGTTDLSMFLSGQRTVFHPVSQPLAIHGIAAGPEVPPAA